MASPPNPSSSSHAAEAIVRFATETDVPTILAMIQELATYENASTSVHATESSLLETLSFPSSSSSSSSTTNPPGYARTLLIFPSPSNSSPSEQLPCAGFALYFHNYSTWRSAPGIYLEDLFVRPQFRGRGYGKRLLGELARETKRVGGERLEWSVLKWNEPSLRFYEGCGAKRMEGWVGMRVDDLGGGEEGAEGGKEGALGELGRWGRGVEWK